MLKANTIFEYSREYHPQWAYEMPEGCPPEDIQVPFEHPFFRLAQDSATVSEEDFVSYAERDPQRQWGEMLPLAVGLSLLDSEVKARKNLKLPMLRQYKGIISLVLNPTDGVAKQTGIHRSHYTWWRTKSFEMSNVKILVI